MKSLVLGSLLKKVKNGVHYFGSTRGLADPSVMQCLLDVISLNPAARRPKQP